jgi:nitroimidazol reductase NimA-like FMN-containing flavoprotein (pyridoxamine 5'-phosphate oxidase superfamily)
MEFELRNKKRGITETEARELLQRGEYGILSTCGPDGEPYGIPLSYCLLGDAVYFHCAVTGRKLSNLAANDRVSFCVVGVTEVLPDLFATRYESVIASGRASEVFGEEKQQALEGLVIKYSAEFHAKGLDYIKAAWEETKTYRISIENICGKARR